MPTRVGIPRGLSFYRDFPPWRAFLECLGAEVVVSPPTTRATLEAGIAYTVPEACLPLKVFCGHVRALAGQCDALLVPSFVRFSPASTNCAKLIGLPDLLRATMPDLPPLIAPTLDLSQGGRGLWPVALQVGSWFTRSPLMIREAALEAWRVRAEMGVALRAGRLTPAGFFGKPSVHAPEADLPPAGEVAVVGHPYILYDPFISHNLLRRLARLGLAVVTPEMLAPPPGDGYWTFEHEFVGAAQAAAARGSADGLVAVVAFGCGPDGVMLQPVREIGQAARLPVLALTLDEHSGEAGLVTRLEAFVDMIRWRKQRQRDGPLPGH
jgi:predicted nucleotide-binding protein (sugar kinase/HSP70/actin superfamily)